MKNIKKAFIDYLKFEKNYSFETLKNYEFDVEDFLNFFKINNYQDFNISKNDIRAYLKHMDDINYSNTTISRHLSSLRSFYNYLNLKNICENNIFRTQKKVRNYLIFYKLPK